MLGRLARYLRMLGFDTAYAKGDSDDAIAARAAAEGRRLLTRDRRLAQRVPGAVLLTSPFLPEQLRQVHAAVPSDPFQVVMQRCTLCNGSLRPPAEVARDADPAAPSVGAPVPARPIYTCAVCGHRYWEGSHTEAVRTFVSQWLAT